MSPIHFAAFVVAVLTITYATYIVCKDLNAWLDGWDERRDARKRNQAHRR